MQSGTGINYLAAGGIGATVTANLTGAPNERGTQVTVGPGGITGTLALGNGPHVLQTIDASGKVTGTTDPAGNTWTMSYGEAGGTVTITDPLSQELVRTFDAAGRLVSQTNRNGLRRDLTYDGDNRRVATETWFAVDGTTVLESFAFTYDAAGRVLTASNSAGTYTLTYGANGLVQTQTDPHGVTLTFGYDEANHVTSVADSLGGLVTSTFDAESRLNSRVFTAPGQTPLRIDFTYDAAGNVATQTRYSDTAGTQLTGSAAFVYNANYQVTHITYRDAAGAVVAEYGYTYDTFNRVASRTENGVTTVYTYDANHQLLSDGTQTWTYDANGNRTLTGYVTGAANRLLSDGTWDYAYDAEGNVTGKTHTVTGESWSYQYDTANRLTVAEQRDASNTLLQRIEYTYDAFGRRVAQAVWTDAEGTVTTRFSYNADGSEVWADLDASNTLQTRYLRGDRLDELYGRADATGLTGFVTDHLGSVRGLTDGSGAITSAFAFDPFGNLLSGDAQDLGRYGWVGRELDGATGLYHGILGRNYDPAVGRWYGEDPTLFRSHETNLYRYAGNSPTNLTDPSGLFSSWKPAWVDAVADAAADLAHSTANYVAEKAEQLFTTIQVGAPKVSQPPPGAGRSRAERPPASD